LYDARGFLGRYIYFAQIKVSQAQGNWLKFRIVVIEAIASPNRIRKKHHTWTREATLEASSYLAKKKGGRPGEALQTTIDGHIRCNIHGKRGRECKGAVGLTMASACGSKKNQEGKSLHARAGMNEGKWRVGKRRD
jgi:hypothetical protein